MKLIRSYLEQASLISPKYVFIPFIGFGQVGIANHVFTDGESTGVTLLAFVDCIKEALTSAMRNNPK
jgi:hypothetical protein